VTAIAHAEARSAPGTRMHLRVAIDYSSRAAITAALTSGETPATDSLLPNVDMVIRTGGERRLSDFLLWECAYAELAFLDVPFPDLSTSDVDAVFADFAARERRFGAVGKQPAPATDVVLADA
jgi:undecaprenyl diphosphate synthase